EVNADNAERVITRQGERNIEDAATHLLMGAMDHKGNVRHGLSGTDGVAPEQGQLAVRVGGCHQFRMRIVETKGRQALAKCGKLPGWPHLAQGQDVGLKLPECRADGFGRGSRLRRFYPSRLRQWGVVLEIPGNEC